MSGEYKLKLPRNWKPTENKVVPVGTVLHGARMNEPFVVKSSRFDGKDILLEIANSGTCRIEEFSEMPCLKSLLLRLIKQQVLDNEKREKTKVTDKLDDDDKEMIAKDMTINGRLPVYYYHLGYAFCYLLITGMVIVSSMVLWSNLWIKAASQTGSEGFLIGVTGSLVQLIIILVSAFLYTITTQALKNDY